MVSTTKKVQQLHKKSAGIFSEFEKMENTLAAHVAETQELQKEIEAEIAGKTALLGILGEKEQESATVLQNLKVFLGRK